MKRIFSIFCMSLLLFVGIFSTCGNQKVFAEEAPALSSFNIIGYSYDAVRNSYGKDEYLPTSVAEKDPVYGSTAYIYTESIGYGNRPSFFVDGKYYGNPVEDFNYFLTYQDSQEAYGSINAYPVDNLTPGKHTIKVCTESSNPTYRGGSLVYPSFSDSITITVQ
ncbi:MULTISPECIES: hypothetical protein [Clostridium]|uniref:hypothetical protein n=1 Tax=Clostridium TaxID=1485 RepID=UPI0008244628|nr:MULTISPECIES: hypothetical protein [Clostridium]PJI10518.1 hypothetical protein CUB90_00555 [Clostridium sp. CT7]